MSPDKTHTYKLLTRDSIVQIARSWLGTPFKHQGRTKRGLDCAGLIILVGKELKVLAPEFDEKNYPRRSPHSEEFMHFFIKHLDKKHKKDIMPGDVLILKEPLFPCHCGIAGERHGKLTVIHSHAPSRKVIEEYYEVDGWKDKHVMTFEYPGTH